MRQERVRSLVDRAALGRTAHEQHEEEHDHADDRAGHGGVEGVDDDLADQLAPQEPGQAGDDAHAGECGSPEARRRNRRGPRRRTAVPVDGSTVPWATVSRAGGSRRGAGRRRRSPP
ncbi:hypothetical protein GCM10027270_30860 [Nocardioides ginkgobilobae]